MTNKTHVSQIDVLESANHVGSGSAVAVLEQGDTGFLAAAGTFFGNVVYVGGYTHICGFAYSDVASAANGLVIEQGMQASDFDTTTPAVEADNITRSRYTIPAANIDDNAFNVQIVAPFVRITYTNGAGAQTAFRLFGYARVIRGL